MPGAVRAPRPRAPGGARRCEGSGASVRGRNQAELPAMGGLRAQEGGGAASAGSSERLSYGASCFTECAGHSASYFPKRARYSYRYSAVTNTFLQGNSYKSSGISLESTVIIEVLGNCQMVLKVQDVQIKKSFASREESLMEMESLREILEQHPLHFSFRDGKVLKLCPVRGEETWALNIKRGMLSVLQTEPEFSAGAVVEEVDVLGICPTKYQQKGPILVKTRDLNLCSHRSSGLTSVQSVVLPHVSSEQQIVSSQLECVQSIRDGVLEEAKCSESERARLFPQQGSGAETLTRSVLTLMHVETETLYSKGGSEDLYVTDILYEREVTKREVTGAEVTELVWKLCLAHSASYETADLFMTLVFELRHLSLEALRALWQRSSFKCRDNWQPLIDALPSCATEACVVLMKDLIASGEVEEDKVEHFFWSFAFIPNPTSGMIESLAPLLKSPRAGQSCFLGVTALVHRFCSAHSSCGVVPAVQSVMRTLGKFLGGNCTVQNPEHLSKLQLVLKAIGNAGLAAAALAPALSSCAALRSHPMEIRLAAVQAFRRIPCSLRNAILVQLYQATSEDVEIRIAAYYIAMKCPHEELFKQVQKTLLKETSSQVGSFVWSHLTQLLETDDPLKEHLRDSIPDEILSKDFDWEMWKYSSYSDVTFHSAGAGANMEASVVFSPTSFLPRSVMTNLTVHFMGQAINLLEVGVRLENAETLLEKGFGPKSSTFSDYFFGNTKEGNHKSGTPVETAEEVKQRNPTLKRYSPTDHLVSKSGKPKLRKTNQNCLGRKYSKMNELVKKFTERTVRKEALKCELSMKIFGNELSFLNCEDLRKQMKHYSLNLAELAVKLLKGQEVQFNKRMSLATEELQFPAISGFPVQLAVNASAAINIKIKGNADFKQQSNFFLNGYIKPSAFVQLSVQMGIVGTLGQAGLKWLTGIRTSTSLDGGIQVKKGKELKVFLNTPEESMEIIDFSSKVYYRMVDETEDIDVFQDHTDTRSCTREEVSEIIGWQLCSALSYPGPASGLVFPLSGPLRVAVTLTKQDRGLQQYVVEAAYDHTAQENSWIPSEAVFHFFLGTPKSDLKRDIGVDLSFSVPQKKFRIQFIQPKKKIEIDGRIEFSKSSRVGHLELIVDDRDVYYIKGMADLQMLSGEQRYMTQLEVKLIKQSSPIILSGNITKQLGKKIAFSVSLNNLLKDAAFLSGLLEKKVDDKQRQYSLEGETHLPGVLGVHAIALLQQREGLWSHGLQIKYGLLGEAKTPCHECSTQQKVQVETGARGFYSLELAHEFHCVQAPSYSHQVHLKHEVTASWISSQMEVNYGKHWDEVNNKKKVLISQAFKNSSSSSVVSYFMEFTMQVLEKQMNYRIQLQHLHTSQVYLQSSTNFEVQYNDHVPFVAGLQWKDASRNGLKKWEGGFSIDTPWLYLYTAHKLHQPQHSAYLLTSQLTAARALSIKDLILELFYKDQGNEKEGKVHIYTPATTYLQASTVNHLGRNVLHSYSEMVSLWNQLVKNEIHLENNERAKLLCFKIKSTKQEFNFTASYQNLPTCEGQIKELRKEKMLYQKRATLHFRHPFKVPFLQSFFLQETFTVDKKQKHYFMETKVLINGVEETVQTLILGYQPENPYICAGLTHPYNYSMFPKDVEMCILTLSHQNLEFPQAMALSGELFSRQTKLEHLDCGVSVKVIINKNMSSQAQAALKSYGENNVNGSLHLHSNGREMLMLEVNMNNEKRRNARIVELRAFLHQTVLTNPESVQFQLMSKIFPSRLLLSSDLKLNENRLHVDFMGAREQKVGFVLSLNGRVQHTFTGLKAIPHLLSLDGLLKCKNNIHDGNINVMVNQRLYGLQIRNRNVFGNTTVHNLTVAMVQNGSQAIPGEARLKGHLELSKEKKRGLASFQVDEKALSVDFFNIMDHGHSRVSGTFTHNVDFLKDAGLPLDGILTATCEHGTGNHTIAIALQSGSGRMVAVFEGHKVATEPPTSHLSVSLKHNISKIKEHGIPFVLEAAGYYENFSRKIAAGITTTVETEQLKIEIEKKITDTAIEISLSLHHDVGGLMDIVPHVLETPARVSLNGSIFTSNFTVILFGHVSFHDIFACLQLYATSNTHPHLEIDFQHSLPSLHSLGIARENQLKVSAMRSDKYKGILGIVLGPCTLEADGEVSLAGNETGWVLAFRNKCVSLEDLHFPTQSRLTGSIQKDKCQAELLSVLETGGKTAHLEVRAECKPKLALEIHFRHDLPQLREIPRENELSITARKHFKYLIGVGIKLGACELQMNGDFDPEKNLQWKMLIENKCQTIQDLGAPMKIDGSGYLLMDEMNLDSQTLITVDESKFRGLLILKVTDERQELDAVLTHNIQGAADIGIPMKMLLDVISEKYNDFYKGFINFCVNNKQITEELNFVQKLDVVSLNYKLTHNIDTLKTLQIKDRIELQIDVVFQGRNTTQERYVHIAAGETSITYIINSHYVGHQVDLFCQSVHSSEVLQASGYPKAINLIFSVQKSENKAKTVCEIQYDEKDITVTVDVDTDFELSGIFVFMAEVKHSISLLHHLGLPFSFKVNYDMSEAKGKLYLRMEKRDFNVSAKLTLTGSSYTNAIEVAQTMAQLKILPRQLMFMTIYQKGNRTHLLRHIALWDGKEIKLTGTYTGLFPKLPGGHGIQARTHQDVLTVIWNEKDKISVSSSLKIGRHRTSYRATAAHPFNYTLKELEVHSLSERRGRKYNQQLQVSGNAGQPAHLQLGLEDKSKMDITAWGGCVTLSAGQLQRILSMEHLRACGFLEQRPTLFSEYLDLNWDDKKFKHNFTYERNQLLYPDTFQLEAVLENIFLTPCAKQKILGKIETNYTSCLDYYSSFEFCDLPNVIVLSGKHQLNKDDIILHSEGRFHLADHGRDEGLIGISIKNQSTADVKNYSLEIEFPLLLQLRAFEDIWLGLTGTAASSSVQSQILVEGIIDQKEKVKVAASKGKECFQYYMGYLQGMYLTDHALSHRALGSFSQVHVLTWDLEEGVEVSACSDGKHMAAINTYLSINGKRQENVGQVTLAAANGSLSFLAHGCGDPVLKAENKLNEIGSLLKASLTEKIKKFDGYLWRFRRSVQHVGFLSEAAGWPSMALQRAAGFLHSGATAVTQVWKQSGIGHVLRSRIPLYLEKIQDVVQQMQNELQKPLATLKDAYYDVTLKPLDEVWKEKTEEHMKKILAFLPKIVKDVWLMKPIQMALKVVKAGLDMATQQVLRWAEATFSRAVSKIRKPLLHLYSFSPRNCSVAGKLPVLPKADLSLQLANITTYLIGEKLMRPLQDLYNLNILAEYYRIKRRMMESPFEYHAMIVGSKHLVTFDGKMYDLASKCSVLLAKDFVHSAFTIILNEETRNSRSLYVEMNQTVITIYPRLKISKMYNFSLMEENCQVLDQSPENSTMNSRQGINKIEVSDQKGVSVSCDFQYDLCTVTLAGWHHGVSAGLFGTNDNEAGNEWMVPNGSFTDNVKEFTQSWQVNKCSLVQKKEKPCPITAKQNICKVFFEEPHSLLRNCFKVVEPEPFYTMCTQDTCDSPALGAACSLAAAFVHLCNRNFVPVEIPPQW
ncbi:uncharacterized protein LOC131090453 [Melospiza georgiana]|uniref:uncharacterized protein LOC131090453 n=1 Tax=Melospiza georgiana TaxID=44398 RepID=UPI0025AC4B36|nr:uncharacterized protein LOC131090453 [Melospiza georgiana]